jgi:hypothetical protein
MDVDSQGALIGGAGAAGATGGIAGLSAQPRMVYRLHAVDLAHQV